ncbi:MAG: glutamyl-tRNA reductase [Methylacidiphilales bacterium]|nr:glutamyl-tRNA reductase [Candidatus Methylacidiphilales bacterium]
MTTSSIFCISIAHQLVALGDRERLRFSSLEECKSILTIDTPILLQTCNRTEIYFYADEKTSEHSYSACVHWVAQLLTISQSSATKLVTVFKDNACAEHLFSLACGLESALLGETQIVAQIRQAFSQSQQAHQLGILDSLFTSALRLAKLARRTTTISAKPTSLISLVFKQANLIFTDFTKQKICVIGAGEIANLALRYLSSHGCSYLTVVNRTVHHGARLAQQFGARSSSFDLLKQNLIEHDLILCAIRTSTPIISTDLLSSVMEMKRAKPCMIADLCLPRAVEPSATTITNLYVFNLEQLTNIRDEHVAMRAASTPAVKRCITQALEEWDEQLRVRTLAQNITAFRVSAEEHKQYCLQKALKKLQAGESPSATLIYLAHILTQRLTHTPTLQLKSRSDPEHMQDIKNKS